MISLAALRIAGVIVAATVALGALYYVVDLIRDAGRNEVWAKVNATIDTANEETDEANAEDAEARALRQRLRATALLTAAKIKTTSQCVLTAEEALVIGAVQ